MTNDATDAPEPATGALGWPRTVSITVTVELPTRGGRRLVHEHVTRATENAMTAVRSSLTTHSTPYDIQELTGTYDYRWTAFTETVNG